MNPPELLYLWHPGTKNIFSGYGLAIAPNHLVGIVMIDRPKIADPAWLNEIKETFGEYLLTAMTKGGERGIVCQMLIDNDSTQYLKPFDDYPLTVSIRDALLLLLETMPAVTLALRWNPGSKLWNSMIIKATRLNGNAWILPSEEASLAVYETTLEKLLPDHPEDWSLVRGFCQGKPMLALLWEPTTNLEAAERVGELVLLAGGLELQGEAKETLLSQIRARREGLKARESFDALIMHHSQGTVWWDFEDQKKDPEEGKGETP